MTISEEAEDANELGNQASTTEEAEPHLLRAMELAPSWAVPPYNLGLAYKYDRQWEKSLLYNHKAYELDPEDDAIRWNLGIAATARGNWELATRMWETFGIHRPLGPGAWDYELGSIVVRVAGTETVWCRRLDLARASITSVPTAACGRRFGDVVLTDGAADGYRGDVPVLNELELLQPSEFATYEARVVCKSRADAERLRARFEKSEWAAEDWTGSLRKLCPDCSKTTVPVENKKARWVKEREFGFAAPPDAALDHLLNGYEVRTLERAL